MTASANDLARLILAQMTQTDVDRRTQAQIDGAMRGAIGDVRRGNPNQLQPAAKVTPIGAQRIEPGTPLAPGWKDEARHKFVEKGSFEEQLIDRMVEKFAGGPNEPVKGQ